MAEVLLLPDGTFWLDTEDGEVRLLPSGEFVISGEGGGGPEPGGGFKPAWARGSNVIIQPGR
jgi:hypothetical protein